MLSLVLSLYLVHQRKMSATYLYLILFYLGEVLGVTSAGLEHYAVTSSLTLPRTPEKDVFLVLYILSCSI